MPRRYFLLLARETPQAHWGIQFGDYDRETVTAERDEYRGQYAARNLKIVTSNSARQSCCDYVVSRLNKAI